MSLLSDKEIIKGIECGDIFISNFNPVKKYYGDGKYTGKLNPNGYNLTLNNTLKVYKKFPLDMKVNNETETIIIPEEGYVLQPGILYIGSVNEITGACPKYCPSLEGRSSYARLGLSIHKTSGFGDAGFNGVFTLEIDVIHPLRIYPNVDICQIVYHTIEGEVKDPYKGKYQNTLEPTASRSYMDEIFEEK